MLIVIYLFLLFLFGIYSYVLVDPSLTLVNNQIWIKFREIMIPIGYYQRPLSSVIYVTLIVSLFVVYYFLIKKKPTLNPIKIAIFIGLIAIFSYPFLSRDFFNYIFDAKILTFYHKNPYLFKPLDFPKDRWLRFMNWTHRSYPYGPIFLIISLIPSFFSFNKFILNFLFFKLMFVIFYLVAVYCLKKINNKLALIFALNPYVIIEGLISSHNDMIGVCLALIGSYLLFENKKIRSTLFMVLSLGIKYNTFPYLFITKSNKKINIIIIAIIVFTTCYITYKMDFQPWYFLILFGLLPFYKNIISQLNIFFMGLLLSYYPFIRYGDWDSLFKTTLRKQIIIVALIINIIYFFLWKRYIKKISIKLNH